MKFVNVRYGNVLNSRGSIIPLLHKIGKDSNKTYFNLTSEYMTRFVMTLEQSAQLIEYAILISIEEKNKKEDEDNNKKQKNTEVVDITSWSYLENMFRTMKFY
jgi:FlaA1/EpsC-like NDP-sugar epimerase